MLARDAVPVLDLPRHVMNDTNSTEQRQSTNLYKPELPNSQESIVSTSSSTFSAPTFQSSSSNLSLSTAAETDVVSSATSYAPSSQSQNHGLKQAVLPSPTQGLGQHVQHAPRQIDTVEAQRTGDTAASPMSLDSPLLPQGLKRTANGLVKSSSLTVDSIAAPTSGHKRNKSTESGSNPRIGELSAQLKTRLSYAMVKVQNGWEKKSLEDLEDETSQRGSPISAPGRGEFTRPVFDSSRDIARTRRPSALSENSDQIMLSPGQQSSTSEMSRSLGTTPLPYWRSPPKHPVNFTVNALPGPVGPNGAVLAPPAEIGSRRKRRSSASYHPPSLLTLSQRKHYSDLGAGPRTPNLTAPRPGILRMPSQQAEKDAVDTLLFMSSPNNSGTRPRARTDAAYTGGPLKPGQYHNGPLREDVPARRVMFENHIINGKTGEERQPVPQSNGHQPIYPREETGR